MPPRPTGRAGEQDADEHQPPRPEAVDDDAREEAEERADHELAKAFPDVTWARVQPSSLHEEVVEEGQAVEGEAHDREERQERRGDGQRLVPLAVLGVRSSCPPGLLCRLQPRGLGPGRVERVERIAARGQPLARRGRAVAECAADLLALSGRPARTSAGISGYESTIRPRPTKSAPPSRTTRWATFGSHSCR